MQQLLRGALSLDEVEERLITRFAEVFNQQVEGEVGVELGVK
jgi:hypothetical protein